MPITRIAPDWYAVTAHPTLGQPTIKYMFSPTTNRETAAAVIREYPFGVPAPDSPMLISHIYKAGSYAIIRMPGVKITKPTLLCPSEVDCVSRHLREFDESHPDCHKKLFFLTHGDLQYFLHAIFRDWDSSKEIGPMPVLRKRRFDEYTVALSVFRVDLPYLPESPGVNIDGRRRGDKAYMALFLNKVGMNVSYKWMDKFGNEVDEAFVRNDVIHDPECPGNPLIKNLIMHYDTCEKTRVMSHNFKLAIWGARAQIQVFSDTGLKYGTKYFPKAEIFPAEKLLLARAFIRTMIHFWGTKIRT
ncbi:hypothetical protein ACHAPU_000135 [Fusarium lateritium]